MPLKNASGQESQYVWSPATTLTLPALLPVSVASSVLEMISFALRAKNSTGEYAMN